MVIKICVVVLFITMVAAIPSMSKESEDPCAYEMNEFIECAKVHRDEAMCLGLEDLLSDCKLNNQGARPYAG